MTIFYCLGNILLLSWLWGLCVKIWSLNGINFMALLDIDENIDQNNFLNKILSLCMELSLSLMISLLFVINIYSGSIYFFSQESIIIQLITITIISYFCYRFSGTIGTYKHVILQVVLAPFYPVSFRDGYIGDLLTSLSREFINIYLSIIYIILSIPKLFIQKNTISNIDFKLYSEGWYFKYIWFPLFTLMPLNIRLLQCLRRSIETGKRWPHMGNALKYTSAILVISLSIFHPMVRKDTSWLLCFFCSTLYQYMWDLTMDWGMLQYNTIQNKFYFRKNLIYKSTWIYISAIIINFLLRFTWLILLVPTFVTDEYTLFKIVYRNWLPFISVAEICRRMLWSIFRLEWEHLEVYGCPMDKENTTNPDLNNEYSNTDYKKEEFQQVIIIVFIVLFCKYILYFFTNINLNFKFLNFFFLCL